MKRRSFLRNSAVALGAAAAVPASASTLTSGASGKSVYELRIYQLNSTGAKNSFVEYLTGALIPYWNLMGGKVGIFSEYSLEEPPKLYVLLTLTDGAKYFEVLRNMESNAAYLAAAKNYLETTAQRPLYSRYDTLLLEAFDTMPALRQPTADRGLLELRIYESNNEDSLRRKILMFDKEEIPLFDKIGITTTFFGKNIAGGYMPALTYMSFFKDMDARNKAWDAFRVHPEWIAMRDKPEYANTVSKVRKIFLVPEAASQI